MTKITDDIRHAAAMARCRARGGGPNCPAECCVICRIEADEVLEAAINPPTKIVVTSEMLSAAYREHLSWGPGVFPQDWTARIFCAMKKLERAPESPKIEPLRPIGHAHRRDSDHLLVLASHRRKDDPQ